MKKSHMKHGLRTALDVRTALLTADFGQQTKEVRSHV
jgi:hypothetical protein